MSDHVYKVIELVDSSTSSIEDAIQSASKRADHCLRNLRGLRWCEPVGRWRTAGSTTNKRPHP